MAVDLSPDVVPNSHRARKKRDTWRRINRVALALVLERGIDQVTVPEIAAGAEVSPRTLFNYFASKEDAVVGDDPDSAGELAQRLRDRPAAEPLKVALCAAVRDQVAQMQTDPDLLRQRRQVAHRHPELAARLAGAGQRREVALVEAAYERAGTDPATDISTGLWARIALAAARSAFAQHRVAGEGHLGDRLEVAFGAAGLR
ncbi:MAG: TetR/AcrR family transcriptional regulator [Propioniciclava sp.]